MPDTVCMSTNSSTADQIKFTSMNAQLASGQQTKVTWTITTPNNSAADYNILYSENASSVKATQLTLTNLLTLQFLATGKYTFTLSTSYKSGSTTKTVTTTKSIVVVDCTITTCSGGDAEMPGFTEDFGTLPTTATRKAYSPASAVGYTYSASGDPADNYYAISNTTHLKGDWITTSDHTGSTRGGMLVANSSTTPTVFFQKEVDGLCRGSVYNFSAWFINADSSYVMTNTCSSGFIYAGVTFQIVNAANTSQILASFRTYAVSPNFSKATWQRFGGSFTVPTGVTNVIVRIINNFPGGCGNDIALDDIQFSYCSPIITASILGAASSLKEVLCEGVATTLVSSYTPTNYFTNAEYQWEMSDDGGVTWFDVPFGTANNDTLVITEGELKGTKDVAADYLFRVRIYESGSSSQTCAAPSSSVKITILPMPILYLTKTQVCEGGTVDLQASGGYDYFKWNDTSYVGPDRQITVVSDTTITVYGYITYGVDGGKTCIDSNSATIKKDDKPIVEVAASDTSLCVGSRVTLSIADALAPNGDATKSIRWYKGSSVATGTLLSDYNDQTGMIYNTETLADSSFIVVVTNGTCTVTSAPFIIHLTAVPSPPAGTHVTKCVEDGSNASGTFTMTRSTITGTKGVWTITGISGPGISGDTSSTINFSDYVTLNKNNPAATVTLNNPGITVYLQWTVTATGNSDCVGYAYDTLTLITGATTAYAGPDTTLCGTNNVFTMQANEPDLTLTGDFAETGTWSIVGSSTGVTIDDIHAYNTTVRITNGSYQDVTLAWTINNASGCGTNSDQVVLHYTALPTMTLKPDTVCNTQGYFTMDTTATSGTPTYYSVTGTMSGFSAVPETQITSWPITVPIPTGVAAGVYTFTVNFRSNNGGCTNSTTIKVNVETPPTAPTSVTVSAPSICTSGSATLTVVGGTLGTNANGTTAGQYVWYAGGCGSGTSIGTGSSITVSVSATTTYYVRVESNGKCGTTACASGTVTVYTAPTTSNAGPAQTHCNDSLFTMAANSASVGAGAWTYTGTATITNTSSPTTTVFVPAGKTATLTWTITNGACTTSSTVLLTNYMQPVTANAGPDSIMQCANSTFTMQATAASPSTATGTWSTFTGSKATITTGMFNNPAATVTLAAGDTATLKWTVTNGTCSSTDYVKLINYATPSTANAGPDSVKQCATPSFTMAATTPTIGTGKWSIKSGTATIGTADSSKVNAVITVATGSTATLYWTVTNGTCSSKDSIVLVNYAMPTTANAGPDSIVQCNNASFTMLATAAAPATAVGTWSTFTGSKATITTGMFNNAAATVTLAAGDTATLIWTVTNGVCSSTDYVLLKNYQAPSTAQAGLDSIKQCANTTFTMSATAASVGVGTWTVSKATATITSPNSTTTTITVPVGDSVMAYWTIVNGTCSTRDSIKLVNYVKPTDAEAGPDQHQCATTTFTMAGNAPSVSTASGMWTKPTGSTATIANPTSPTTTVTLPTGDSTKLYWTITNGACTTTDSVWIVNNLSPTAANAGPDTIKQCNNATFTMSANTPSVSGAWGTWTVVSPSTYTISAAQLNNPTATFSVTAGQTVVLKWTITNIGCTSSDNIVLINYVQPTATSAGTAQTHCSDSLFTLAGSTPMTGATGYWYVRSGTATVTTPTSATSTVIVPAGQTALLRWVITNGVCADSASVTITNYKQPVAANAGPDSLMQCANSTFTMQATTPAIGTGTWSTFTGSKATITTGMFNNPAATVTLAAGDTATLIWTVTNGTCSSTDYVKLINYATPTTANAGPDSVKQCATPSFTMAATTPTIGTGKWSVKSGTATIGTADSSKVNAVITVATGSTATLYWTVTNGTCSSKDSVVLVNYAMPTTANAGPDSIVQCNNASFTMQATAAAPATAVGTWSTFTGSKATITTGMFNNAAATVTLAAGDTATLIWTVTNGVCSSTDYVYLKNYQAPSTAQAGLDSIKQCANTTFTMSATAASVGVGTWTVSKATATITSPNSTTTTITVPVGDSVMAYWTIVNGTCSTRDSIKLVNYVKPTDAEAGPDQHQCATTTFTMAGNAPSVSTASGMWTKPTGSTATIANPTSPTTTVTLPTGDSTKLYWTITNGACTTTDSVWIVNNLSPTAANAGPDTIKQCNNATFTMSANSPSVSGAWGTWTVVSPSTYTISAAQLNNPTATFSVTAGQTVVLKWTITNIGCTSSDNIVLINYVQPTATSAGTAQQHCSDSLFTLAGSTPMTGATGYWYVRSGTATVTTPTSATSTVIVPAGQTALLRWVITNGVCADSASVTITNYKQPVAANAGPDSIMQCANSTFTMQATTPAIGTGTWSTFTGSKATITTGMFNNPAATVTLAAGDTATLIWTVTNGLCSSTDYVKLINYATPSTANAGPDSVKQCATPSFTMAATTPTIGTGKWSVKSGTATIGTADSSKVNAVITVATGSTATLYWTVTNGTCSSKDSVVLVNYAMPTTANAGPDSIVQCNNASFTMQATAAAPATAVGTWSTFTGSKATITTGMFNNAAATVTLAAGDTATLIWTVTNGVCSSTDYVFLKNYQAPSTAQAGLDSIKQCANTTFIMSATATSVGVGTWTVSKATATITSPNSTTTTITVPVGDSVMAYWTIVNGTCSTRDSIKLVNYVKPTDVEAGPDQHQCNTATFTMAANAPSVSTASGTWSKPAGSTATIASVNSPTTTVTIPVGDSSMLYWTITNGVCADVDTVWIVNNNPPANADAGVDTLKHCNYDAFTMTANTPSVAGATGYWSVVSPASYTISAAQLNDPNTTFTVTAGSTVVLSWTITNLGCTTSDNIVLINYEQPTATSAGSAQSHCSDSLFTLASSTPMTGATGYWYVRSGTATVTTPTSATSTVIVPAGQTALLSWVITNGVCADSASVTLINYMQPVTANAGPDSIMQCANSTFTMQATTPAIGTGTWSTFTGSTATITTGMFNDPAATVTLAAGDTATLIWTVTNGLCSSIDYVKLINYATPSTADAGPDSVKQCATPSFTMAATTPTIGTGKWSIKSGTATIGTADSSNVNAVITVATGSTATLYWTVTNGTCFSKDSIVLVNYAMPTTADAGPDSIVQCNNASFTMQATAVAPATAVGTWSTFTGSTATITTGMFNNPAATVTLAAGDTATLIWTVTNGVCASTDYVFLKNYQAPATAQAGPDSIRQCANDTFTMSATAASVGVGTWTVSKATATITSPNSPTTTITVPVGDSVMAYWTVVNGTCSTIDSVKLVNYVKPADADAGPDQHQCNTATFTMTANAPSVSTASGTWSKPAGSTATIASVNSPTT
ncbi:hypothetical protein BW716_26400, partial [[Flexibacter] sp. ATCC 35208]